MYANTFLVTVTDPLQLTLATCIERELQNDLGLALQGQLEFYKVVPLFQR
jgi:hypothetical protein